MEVSRTRFEDFLEERLTVFVFFFVVVVVVVVVVLLPGVPALPSEPLLLSTDFLRLESPPTVVLFGALPEDVLARSTD